MGLKGHIGRGAKRRPTKKEQFAQWLEVLAVEYPLTCGPAYDATREEEVFLLDLYVQNDEALGDAGVMRYVAQNTSAAARHDPEASTLPKSSRERGDATKAALDAKTLVSVIVPTTGKRAAFHAMLYACFARQTHPALELVVLDTGDAPSPFFSADPAALGDARVRYVHDEHDAATGAKRNSLVTLARGAIVVQFDDDDVYTSRYVERVVSAMRETGAKLFKLSAWKWFDAARASRADCDDDKLVHWYDNEKDKTTGLCPNYTAAGWHSRKWGYGFSFAFDRAVALRCPFPATFLGEDYDFVMKLLHHATKIVAYRDDPDDAVVLHVLHNNNSSVVAKHRTFKLSDLDAGFQEPIGDIIKTMRKNRAFDTELSSYVSLARKARYEEGEFK